VLCRRESQNGCTLSRILWLICPSNSRLIRQLRVIQTCFRRSSKFGTTRRCTARSSNSAVVRNASCCSAEAGRSPKCFVTRLRKDPQLTISPASLKFRLKTLFCITGLETAILDLRSAVEPSRRKERIERNSEIVCLPACRRRREGASG
jgi:hypothetical protein